MQKSAIPAKTPRPPQFTPNTKPSATPNVTGAYCPPDYGCGGREGFPVWLETSGYLHVDQGGDSGTGEYSIMALDYLTWTSDAATFSSRYLRIATQAAEFFMHHFPNRSADGRAIVWPAQVLETYWCTWDTQTQTFTNCCENDAPTISGMIAVFEKLLQLPPGMATPSQVAAWTAFSATLMPLLPLTADGQTIAPAQVLSSGVHNSEGPELYAIHPHRLFTRGREVATGANVSLGRRTVAASGWAASNDGWTYGINAHALIGDSEQAAAQLLERATTKPAAGYRWPGFAPHMQDFDPSADHFANMNRALQEMLIQSGEDGFISTSIVLLPAWPCGWDVNFKLWAPLNTTVEVVYAGGALVSLDVNPPSRKSAVKWANCVPNGV